jgi:hypothetical protein
MSKFVSGIVIAKNLAYNGFHLDLCLKTWSRMCNEIVIVTDKEDLEDIQTVFRIMEGLGETTSSGCFLKVRAIEAPTFFELYRFAGYLFCSHPNYVVHFDADYLISPSDAGRLREAIEKAPEDNDIITYRIINLNRSGTHIYMDDEAKVYTRPYDGYSGIYPFVLNVRRQNFIMPFDVYEEKFNNRVAYESAVNLGHNWGSVYDQKIHCYCQRQGIEYDPKAYGIGLLDSGADVEHLTWSMKKEAFDKKLAARSRVQSSITKEGVEGGTTAYEKDYEELREFRARMPSRTIPA